ncbi:hypothetical protein F4680DRAFT_418099 [Xylaria scruposa]|nr:hypothetical protein F4680DRAFT_418099 [Xylaria scruposa]
MNARENQIQPVSTETTTWIFDQRNPHPEARGVSFQFTEWLEAEDPVFWISGKPGSGKSSLMKFLVSDIRTNEHLSRWKPDVTICRYFFIETGQHPLQREFRGCLRALLYQILDSKPHVLGLLLRQKLNLAAKHSEHDWSVAELRDVFLVALRLTNCPICVFLDGLDEIAPESDDRDAIIGLVEELSDLGNAKICVSSRPENIFKDRLSLWPYLQMQNFNRPGIRLYIQSQLAQYEPDSPKDFHEYCKLMKALERKSSGVFLWVYLATKSIIRGIQGQDSWHTLYRRTIELESDLHLFFQRMFERQNANNCFYKEDTARLLWYYLYANSMDTSEWKHSSTLLAYIFATHTEFSSGLLHSVGGADRITEETQVSEKYRKWLFARGAGLLEINKKPTDEIEPTDSSLTHHTVGPIHRSVQEFLLGTNAGRDILLVDRRLSKERLLQAAGAMEDVCYYLADGQDLFEYTRLLFTLGLEGHLTAQEEAKKFLDCKSRLQSRAPKVFPDAFFLEAAVRTFNAQLLSEVLEAPHNLSAEEKSFLLSAACQFAYALEIRSGGLLEIEDRVAGGRTLNDDYTEQSMERLSNTISVLLRTGADLNAKVTTYDLGGLTISITPFHRFLASVIELSTYRHLNAETFYPKVAVCYQEFKQYRIDWDLPFYFCPQFSRLGILMNIDGLQDLVKDCDCIFAVSSKWLEGLLDGRNPRITGDKNKGGTMEELYNVEFKVRCVGVRCTKIIGGWAVRGHGFQPPDPNKIEETRQFEEVVARSYSSDLYNIQKKEGYVRFKSSSSKYIKLLSQYIYT